MSSAGSRHPITAGRRPVFRRLAVEGSRSGGARQRAVWSIAEETPVEIGFNGRPWVVMLASPEDLEDLAVGLSWTEGVIIDPAMITGIQIAEYPEGITVDVSVAAEHLTDRLKSFRALEGRTGCGLCGVESLADTVPRARVRPKPAAIEDDAVARALGTLGRRQPLNEATRSVHGAAWCSTAGEILEVREDVGRHNALDKLIGALLGAGTGPEDGFIVMSSRCSMELVQKAAAFGAPLLATISAPTLRALELARATGLSVRCAGPDGTIMSFELEGGDAES